MVIRNFRIRRVVALFFRFSHWLQILVTVDAFFALNVNHSAN